MIVAIDPGKHASGWAVFWDGKLWACGFGNDADPILDVTEGIVDLVVLEVPRVYDRKRWKGDPNDLIDISVAGGILVGALRPETVKLVRPQDWKGQTPKGVQADRTLAKLTKAEAERLNGVASKSKLHNVIDAIGIGLWELKRCQNAS
jgi:hypothetical protein